MIFEVASIDGRSDVVTVGAHGLAVVTSDVVQTSFSGLERAEAVNFLAAHQRVLETVRRDYAVLPVKFGTVLPDDARLQTLLRQGTGLFQDALATYASKEQYEVVVLWEVAPGDPANRYRRAHPGGEGAGEPTAAGAT